MRVEAVNRLISIVRLWEEDLAPSLALAPAAALAPAPALLISYTLIQKRRYRQGSFLGYFPEGGFLSWGGLFNKFGGGGGGEVTSAKDACAGTAVVGMRDESSHPPSTSQATACSKAFWMNSLKEARLSFLLVLKTYLGAFSEREARNAR